MTIRRALLYRAFSHVFGKNRGAGVHYIHHEHHNRGQDNYYYFISIFQIINPINRRTLHTPFVAAHFDERLIVFPETYCIIVLKHDAKVRIYIFAKKRRWLLNMKRIYAIP